MGILVSKVFASLFGSKEVRILILGLDNAGKTTILYRLQADEIEQTVPTIGFNMETLQYKNIKFQVWDLGGQTSIRPYWRCYYPNTDAIIFTVDSADIDRLHIAKQELHAMLEEEELKDSILLVFANKQDQKGALNAAQISEAMGLSEIRNRQWSIKETTATSGAGLFEGFDCVIDPPFPTTNRVLYGQMIYDDPASRVWDGPVDQWPADHCVVLHCIAQYAQQAKSVHSQESWIRQIALLVLLNEGIESGVLKFDYAPNLTWLSYQRQTERRWLCISQEAKSVVDDLWEARLVNGLKLSSIDYQPVTAFQVSTRGLEIAVRLPQRYKDAGDRIIYPPPPHPKTTLLRVRYDGADFNLQAGDFYTKTSKITQVEDVSYVSSPYLPSCIRSTNGFRVKPTCNRLRATESARGHNMMAKDAKESIILAQVRALVGEWMPFGANQIAALNDRLGAMDRCQGGLFSAKIDDKPTETHFDTPSELTQVKILDFDSINFINFEAEITSEEAEGVIQVENFGMHLNVSGALLYGVKIEAIMHRTERDIPLDLLARLVVDIQEDSSDIITNLLSRYQLSVLDMLFMNKAKQRNKFNLLMASGITPKLAACKYLDKGDRENELKQVLGEIYACYDITREDVLFLGREGCLLAGPNADRHEPLLTTFIGLNSRELFIRNFFVRTFVLDDTLQNLRKLIRNYRKYPGCLPVVKATLSEAARNIILLVECLQYLLESVEDIELPAVPLDVAGAKIFKSLSLLERKNNILIRCKDSIKLIERLRTQLDTLIMKFETITRVKLADASRDFDLNINPMLDTLQTRRRIRSSMDAVRVILAGNLAFEVVDRLSGGTFNVAPPPWFIDWIKTPLIDTPMVFFVLNLVWFALVWRALQWYIATRSQNLEALMVVRALVDKHINISALHRMVRKKAVRIQTVECTRTQPERQLYIWTEHHFPTPRAETQMELLVDERQQLLRSIRLQVFCPIEDAKPLQRQRRKNFVSTSFRRLYPTPSSTGLTENGLLEQFTNVLRKQGVYVEPKAPLAHLGSMKHMHRVKIEHVDRDMRSRRQRFSQTFKPTLL